jgi:hypothetical protein
MFLFVGLILTSLQAAVFVPHPEVVALLLAKGVNPDVTNHMGMTARQVNK